MDRDTRQRVALDAPLGAHLLQPDSQVIERPGWYQVLTPSVKDGALNEVVRCQELEGRAPAEVVAAEVARYGALGLDLKWCVGPAAARGLHEALAQAGFGGWWARAMAITPSADQPPCAPEVSLEEVRESAGLGDYAAVVAEGWKQTPERAAADAQRALAAGTHRLFLARLEGRPAGAAAVFLRPSSEGGAGYLTGAVVLPAARKRGLYRALVSARLAALAAAGVPLATTQARDHSSAPILKRLGFETLFQVRVFLRPAGPPL